MTAVSGPILLTAQEFAANPLGADISKLLKDVTSLNGATLAGAASIAVHATQGAAPGRFDPKTSAIASYAVGNGDMVFVGAGTAADPMEWTVATGPFTGSTDPFMLPVSPALTYAHPNGSPVTVGELQQELLSAALAVEGFCRQPIALVTHPDNRWPNAYELTLDQIWFSVDQRGIPIIFPPYLPVVTAYTPTLQYKLVGGTANAWTAADITQWEVLSDRLIGPAWTFIRGQFVVLKLGYQSGYAVIPDDVKAAMRFTAARLIKERGGQAVISTTGRLVSARGKNEDTVDLPALAKGLLQPFRAVR